jgi:hypothetical protein
LKGRRVASSGNEDLPIEKERRRVSISRGAHRLHGHPRIGDGRIFQLNGAENPRIPAAYHENPVVGKNGSGMLGTSRRQRLTWGPRIQRRVKQNGRALVTAARSTNDQDATIHEQRRGM